MNNTIKWLLNNAGPVIKYRVINELCEDIDAQTKKDALSSLLALPETKKRLSQLKCQDVDKVHGSKSDCFENSLPKVLDFGLKNNVLEFSSCIDIDKIIEYYEMIDPNGNYYKKIMYPILYKSGYRNTEIVNHIKKRIDQVFKFTSKMDFNIYDDIEKYKSMPKNYRDRPVIKKELYQDNDYVFPQIYDMLGFVEIYETVEIEYKNKIDNIIQYIISPEYNKGVVHYGVIQLPNKRYSAVGWDCMLPLFYPDSGHQSLSIYLHRLELYSIFPCVKESRWFKIALENLERYKTTYGTFILDNEYLIERDHCWFLGEHMGLCENRRCNYQESESTFRMLKIKRNAGLC